MKIIAAILEQPVIEKILTHLGLQARAPPRAPARGQALQARFAAELSALTRRLDTPLTLIVDDNAVRAVHLQAPGRVDVNDLQRCTAVPGAGGTDFTPLLEEASRHRPDLTVVLTDLEGPARPPPPGALLWAVPPGADEAAIAAAPFGRVLRLR